MCECARLALGMPQSKFGALVGLHAVTISKIERGVLLASKWNNELFEVLHRRALSDEKLGGQVLYFQKNYGNIPALMVAMCPPK